VEERRGFSSFWRRKSPLIVPSSLPFSLLGLDRPGDIFLPFSLIARRKKSSFLPKLPLLMSRSLPPRSLSLSRNSAISFSFESLPPISTSLFFAGWREREGEKALMRGWVGKVLSLSATAATPSSPRAKERERERADENHLLFAYGGKKGEGLDKDINIKSVCKNVFNFLPAPLFTTPFLSAICAPPEGRRRGKGGENSFPQWLQKGTSPPPPPPPSWLNLNAPKVDLFALASNKRENSWLAEYERPAGTFLSATMPATMVCVWLPKSDPPAAGNGPKEEEEENVIGRGRGEKWGKGEVSKSSSLC